MPSQSPLALDNKILLIPSSPASDIRVQDTSGAYWMLVERE